MVQKKLLQIFTLLKAHYGELHWWPGETPFEIMVGAILTQNTNWANVEKAITVLKKRGLLDFHAMRMTPVDELADAVRSSGYYNIKAKRLHNLCSCIAVSKGGDVESFLSQQPYELRKQLLQVKGIGPETADCILLYAAGYPFFVVDAYTYRILFRHQLVEENIDYATLQSIFMDNVESDLQLYNEFHGLIVQVGKDFCHKSKPKCETCPLYELLPEKNS